jgi:hypothetical protein
MTIGQKLFEQTGKITGSRITKVHPIDGIVSEVSFVADVKGFGNFPNCKNIGSGVMTQYPSNGMIDSSLQGVATTIEGGDQIFWWADHKTKLEGDGKGKGIAIVSFFTNSQKLLWINRLIVADDAEIDLTNQQLKMIGYEWV